MKNLNKISRIKRDEIASIVNNKDVTKYFSSIKVFGSSITDHCSNESDIDLFVTLKPEYMNDKDENDSYIALLLASESDKDIFYAHEQKGELNPTLYENMINGVEVL